MQEIYQQYNNYDVKQASGLKRRYELCAEAVSLYNRLDEAGQTKFRSGAASAYYDLACYAARLGKLREAKSALLRCAELGYKDAAWAMDDSDLITLHGSKEMKKAVAMMEKHSYLSVLKAATPYEANGADVYFSYRYDCPEYERTRQYFNLDSIAGTGDEISRLKNLMYYVHNNIRHDGSSFNPEKRDAISMYELCKSEGRGINCRMMALMLNEFYLALGYPSRYVTCMPIDSLDGDCHVINAVFSKDLNKWVWLDPTFAAYVSDEAGNLLSISEVRERLIADKPLFINEDANWNGQSKQTVAHYLKTYMAKNLYLLECAEENAWGVESTYSPRYILLTPKADTRCYRSHQNGGVVTTDAARFWQKP